MTLYGHIANATNRRILLLTNKLVAIHKALSIGTQASPENSMIDVWMDEVTGGASVRAWADLHVEKPRAWIMIFPKEQSEKFSFYRHLTYYAAIRLEPEIVTKEILEYLNHD